MKHTIRYSGPDIDLELYLIWDDGNPYVSVEEKLRRMVMFLRGLGGEYLDIHHVRIEIHRWFVSHVNVYFAGIVHDYLRIRFPV
jgi:hypothetical protein